jgi:nucleoside-diphosphate-sugar epimerase
MTKRVLVTGGTGFIGRWTIPVLDECGYEIHIVSSKARTIGPQDIPAIYHQCDLLNHKQMRDLVEKVRPTHLLHLAWDVTHGEFWTSQTNFSWVSASLDLLKAFHEFGGQRVIMAGTCAEYDWNYGYCVENVTPIVPATFYGVCKSSLAAMLSSFGNTYNLSTAWGRIFHLYGPDENKARLVPSVITNMIRGETVKCSHGNQIRDFMYSEDVAAAFVALLDSEVEGSVNITSGIPVSLKDVIETIGKELDYKGEIAYGSIPTAESDPPLLVGDNKRLIKEVGFMPRFSLEEGIRKYLQLLTTKTDSSR